MNTRTFAAAALALSAALTGGAAVAQEATSDAWMAAPSTLSRGEVQAQLQQARRDGTIRAWSAGYIEPVKSAKLRAQVVAETLAARRSGELDAIQAEAPALNPAQPATGLARAPR